MLVAVAAVASVVALPRVASAESIFDFFFGGFQKQQQRQGQASFFADPFGLNQQPAPPPRSVASASGPAFCVRSCDGKYFPLARGNATPVQMCQAFCPASATKLFFGSSIDGAYASNGERYADSENAFAYRKALRADCTCNGRDPRRFGADRPDPRHLAASRRRGCHHQRAGGVFRCPGRRQPDCGIYAGCIVSGPDRRDPRAARRDEGGTGCGHARQRNAAAWGKPRSRAARDFGAEDRFGKGEAGGSGINKRWPLMVRSATSRVSNHEATVGACSHPSRRRAKSAAPQDEGWRRYRPTMTPITFGADRYFSSI